MNDKFKVLSGSALKVIAIITMIIDHCGQFFLLGTTLGNTELFTIGNTAFSVYSLFRAIGRISFPIFAFLICEGYAHTKNRKKYAISLLLFAVLSEIPWNLLANGTVFYLKSNNVIFTLLFGFLGICVLEYFSKDRFKQIILLLMLFAISAVSGADYGCIGFSVILLIHMLSSRRVLQALICSCLLDKPWFVVLAFIPINMYNGNRGFIRSKITKYVFYSIYPLHLIIIYSVKQFIH